MSEGESAKGKTLAILGSESVGTAKALGNLIYKCGGIELPVLEWLQKKGVNSYERAVEELKDADKELYFYTPKYRVVVKEQPVSTDGLLIVVEMPQSHQTCLVGDFVDQIKESTSFFAQGKVVIVVNAIDESNWSKNEYENFVSNLRAELRHLGMSAESIHIIPSKFQGENFIEPSLDTPWYAGPILVNVLDEILS
ncbi:hypothetical protein DM02DRAFT_619136 [Periconia macrospinosa]|uniref:Uncharacterized protein n=1 Tax=Periconia macrospinosa TaxID=97972 RepID=A0A2V1D907_9PLEO|nr:hypothetical protein DM02DRAFT_619136 [Periconia macrospinosa]